MKFINALNRVEVLTYYKNLYQTDPDMQADVVKIVGHPISEWVKGNQGDLMSLVIDKKSNPNLDYPMLVDEIYFKAWMIPIFRDGYLDNVSIGCATSDSGRTENVYNVSLMNSVEYHVAKVELHDFNEMTLLTFVQNFLPSYEYVWSKMSITNHTNEKFDDMVYSFNKKTIENYINANILEVV